MKCLESFRNIGLILRPEAESVNITPVPPTRGGWLAGRPSDWEAFKVLPETRLARGRRARCLSLPER